MRTVLSISLLAVFLLTHYERYINYLECRLAYFLSTAGEKCDCESLLADPGQSVPVSSATHIHVHPDDIFMPVFTSDPVSSASLVFQLTADFISCNIPAPFISPADRPPAFL